MTVIRPNSISGVSSITGSGGDISIFRADGTAADVTVNNITGVAVTFTGAINAASATITGNLGVGGVLTYEDVTNIDSVGVVTARAGINLIGNDLNVGSNIKIGNASGIVTATSYRGDGSQLTGITGTTINNNANNRVITGSGSANTLEGESTFTFDGSLVTTEKRMVIGNGTDFQIPSRSNTSSYTPQFQVTGAWNDPTHGATMALNGRTDYPLLWLNSGASYANNSGAGYIVFSIKDGAGNYCNTASIRSLVDGTPGNNDSPGDLTFMTTPSGTCNPVARMTIDSNGTVTTPTHPIFATRIDYNNAYLNSGVKVAMKAAHIDTRSSFSDANDRYVAPAAGRYLFYFYSNVDYNGDGTIAVIFKKNGSDFTSSEGGHIYSYAQNTGWHLLGGQIITTMAVNDYIEVFRTANNMKVDGNNYGQFGGYMIG